MVSKFDQGHKVGARRGILVSM